MGVDLERFAPAADDEQPATVAPLRVALASARLVTEKGVEDLVVALRLLRDRGT